MINAFFTKFGLTNNEKSIYIFLLEYGDTIASMIGKRLKIKRVTVYAALETLKKKGLVNSYQRNGVNYFEAVSPEEIVNLCKQKVEENEFLASQAKKLLPELRKVQASQIKPVFELKGKIKYYQGDEAVQKLIYETLEEGPIEQLCFGINDYHSENLWDEWKNYTKERTKVGMTVRSIQPNNKKSREYQKRDKSELRVTRLVPNEKYPTTCELNIIGDMIALFTSHGDKPTGTKIYNADMAQVLRSLFELAWENAGNYDKSVKKKKK